MAVGKSSVHDLPSPSSIFVYPLLFLFFHLLKEECVLISMPIEFRDEKWTCGVDICRKEVVMSLLYYHQEKDRNHLCIKEMLWYGM